MLSSKHTNYSIICAIVDLVGLIKTRSNSRVIRSNLGGLVDLIGALNASSNGALSTKRFVGLPFKSLRKFPCG